MWIGQEKILFLEVHHSRPQSTPPPTVDNDIHQAISKNGSCIHYHVPRLVSYMTIALFSPKSAGDHVGKETFGIRK